MEVRMCLAVPFQVTEVVGTRAKVALAGHCREADMSLVGPVSPGDWVLLHAGFAIETLSAEEARETLELMGQAEGVDLVNGG